MNKDDENIKISDEFLQLCHSQLNLLFTKFFAQESAIYLTDSQAEEPKLIPILVYPDSSSQDFPSLPPLQENSWEDGFSYALDEKKNSEPLINYYPNSQAPHQLILPLIYQNIVLGLLATTRKNSPWQPTEILQIKEITNTIAIARILEQKQQITAEKLSQLQKFRQLENDHLDDFLHQLRNPLTAIRTFAKLLLKRLFADDPNYSTSQSIYRESDRIKELIADFSQQWQGKNEEEILTLDTLHTSFFLTENIENLEVINIINIIKPILENIRIIAEEKNIQILEKINVNRESILTNRKALREIINNLLDNAVKYTPNNGKVRIEIEQNKDDKIIVKIADTGYGIPLEDQKHIFERHYRGSQINGNISGTGLGLAIVKELADKINIKIKLISPFQWLENQVDYGTQFILEMPTYTD
ncbi:GAF domain-containing sensor histidine kinase [Cyanobacterium sp. DS4]|uniref:GAF domain-containing sensor histidine kinase n=1 Tax=Cyanobacterium sp. DS4 TaxID=2878255 RepID=UPI002E808A19|nr:ATP-binding protein [Cyanobacterium sp. Dongsha4]WVL01530.1 sensor histidine kinase [Cyanobacterium sp. Dongsha4]